MRVLVTGGGGFLGSRLCQHLTQQGHEVRATTQQTGLEIKNVEVNAGYSLNENTDWSKVLTGIDVIVHTAARVHVMKDHVSKPELEFLSVNTWATKALAQQAIKAGVKRFIFISTIKVNGEISAPSHPFVEQIHSAPDDAYAYSKWQAEIELLKLTETSPMEVVIVRPPLIYGPGVKGNFEKLLKLVKTGLPLPFGNIENKRSLIAIDNLTSFISLCAEHPKAANQIFVIADGEDVSTSQLIKYIAECMNHKKLSLIPFPVSVISLLAKIFRKGDAVNRLIGSLQVDSSKARKLLGWKPTTTVKQQIKKTVNFYLGIYGK